MKRKILFPLLLSILFGFGCTDLEEDIYQHIPQDKYPENEGQVVSLSVDAYSILSDLIDDWGFWFLFQEISSDGFTAPTRGGDWDDGGKWRVIHRHTWSDDADVVENMWEVLYDGVGRCNEILDVMGQMEQTDEIIKTMAEVETMRTFYYYLLMDNYGDVPYFTSFVDAPEQPYRLARESVFNNLIETLENNIEILEAADKKYLANRYMANMLLAKLYMNAEVYTGEAMWQEASDALDEVFKGPYILETDISEPFREENQNCSETIFSIEFHEDDIQGFRLHMRSLHYLHVHTFDMSVSPWNGFAATEHQFDLYEEGDLRRESWMIWGPQYTSANQPLIDDENPGEDNQVNIDPYLPALHMNEADHGYNAVKYAGARPVKYEVTRNAKESLSNDFPIFRLTDAMLMKAELEIRLNGEGSGDNYINQIRERAGVDPIDNATLQDVLDERGRELWLEGHRRQDLIRYGKFQDAWWEKSSQSGVTTLPVPRFASDANSNLLEEPQQ
ncbi:RagB/SusD family nutrient uptake outer membrane protein [Marinilabiliaceae bacterium ANBcel2]|nr:RagB/SusD family nutrient uptake outer membrane protein [Marinilabiliaceae bacterium ANBcel2]